jgi:hypothetical protein
MDELGGPVGKPVLLDQPGGRLPEAAMLSVRVVARPTAVTLPAVEGSEGGTPAEAAESPTRS